MNFDPSRRALAFAFGIAPLAAPAALFGSQKGSGRIVREEREVGEFHRLELGGALELALVQAQAPRLSIEIDDNLLPLLHSEREGDTLKLSTEGDFSATRGRLVLQAWQLERLEVSGAASLVAQQFASKRLALHASGAGRVAFAALTAEVLDAELSGAARATLAGRANEMQATLGGTAHLAAAGFEVRRVRATMGGAAIADVWAVDTLGGALGGASHLRYRGSPRVDVAHGGASSVRPAR